MLTKKEYYERRNTENPVQKWQRNFVKCAETPGHTASWVQRGVEEGLAQDNPRSRRQLARQMGAVYAAAFDEETGAERRLKELELSDVSRQSRVPVERLLKVGELMVVCGVLKEEKGN